MSIHTTNVHGPHVIHLTIVVDPPPDGWQPGELHRTERAIRLAHGERLPTWSARHGLEIRGVEPSCLNCGNYDDGYGCSTTQGIDADSLADWFCADWTPSSEQRRWWDAPGGDAA